MSDGRIDIIDAWRGIALWLMLIYHLLFDFVMFGWMSWETLFSVPLFILERVIAWSFILCCGIGCVFSRRLWKRVLYCAGAGLLVVAASFVVDAPILFGVLQFLSACMILWALFGKWLQRLRHPLFLVLWLALYFITKYWTESTSVGSHWLFWLGFKYEGFESYDYFPVLPYVFLFLAGTWLGIWVKEHRERPVFERKAPFVLTVPGRHTLLIYLLHQPVLYGVCWLVNILL